MQKNTNRLIVKLSYALRDLKARRALETDPRKSVLLNRYIEVTSGELLAIQSERKGSVKPQKMFPVEPQMDISDANCQRPEPPKRRLERITGIK